MRFSNDRPIFAQIADLLLEDLLAGKLSPGERLPSARELGASLEVNPNTAARALQHLADAAIARVERGMGYFVAEGAVEQLQAERRRRFFEEELPKLFRVMDDLGVTEAALVKHWRLYQKQRGVNP